LLTARQISFTSRKPERAWIHAVIDGHAEEEWVVPADDPAQGWRLVGDAPNAPPCSSCWPPGNRPTQRWLARSPDELGRAITRRMYDGIERTYTVHWILDHVQEHGSTSRPAESLLRMLGWPSRLDLTPALCGESRAPRSESRRCRRDRCPRARVAGQIRRPSSG
jgi:hypothetical protein